MIKKISQQHLFVVVQLLSSVRLLRSHGLQHVRLPCPSLSPGVCTNSVSIESVMPSNHLTLCHPLLLLPSVFPSIRVFSNESALCITQPKYQSFSISPSSEYPGLISFRIDWFDLLTVQGTLKSLLQHHNSEASIPRRSAFLVVQLLHPYMTTEKAHSFDYMGLCWQSDVSAFSYAIQVCHSTILLLRSPFRSQFFCSTNTVEGKGNL